MVPRRLATLSERPLALLGMLAGLVAFALIPAVLFSLLGVAETASLSVASRWPALLAFGGALAVVLGFALATWLHAAGYLEFPGAR